ncbi:MAG: hypothetical protein KGZ83_02280 [Sulfuricella sp.]|nr:hypothetical protein [Sulfuricella sp.]
MSYTTLPHGIACLVLERFRAILAEHGEERIPTINHRLRFERLLLLACEAVNDRCREFHPEWSLRLSGHVMLYQPGAHDPIRPTTLRNALSQNVAEGRMVKDSLDCPTNYGLTPAGEAAARETLEILAETLSCEMVESTIDAVLRTWRTTEPISLLRPIYEQAATVISREGPQATLDVRDAPVRHFVEAYLLRPLPSATLTPA